MVYRPPNTNVNSFISELEIYTKRCRAKNVLLTKRCRAKNVLLIGDTNIDITKNNATVESYERILAANGMTRKISGYTREEIRAGTLVQSCIDHIYYRGNPETIAGAIIETKISDHYVVAASIRSPNTAFRVDNEEFTYDKTQTNFVKLEEILSAKLDMVTLNEINTVEELYNYIVASYREACRHAKSINVSKQNRNRLRKPWLTDDILKQINNRDKVYKLWKRCTEDQDTKENLKKRYKVIDN
ncbi:hypothetical protein QE152_g40723 [Popillia japonica]|uniref:Uncharacterized protein n=1 Tax=Popillia japonica TaxID=7064 RepID=A0AAW1HFC7_POPJA